MTRRKGTYEWCDTCRAGTDTYKTRAGLFCDNCDTHLFDSDDNEVIPTRTTTLKGTTR